MVLVKAKKTSRYGLTYISLSKVVAVHISNGVTAYVFAYNAGVAFVVALAAVVRYQPKLYPK